MDQGGDRLVDFAALAGKTVHEVIVFTRAVHVPAAVEQLHESHALLDEPPGQEAVVGKRHDARLCAVGFVNVGFGSREISMILGTAVCMR